MRKVGSEGKQTTTSIPHSEECSSPDLSCQLFHRAFSSPGRHLSKLLYPTLCSTLHGCMFLPEGFPLKPDMIGLCYLFTLAVFIKPALPYSLLYPTPHAKKTFQSPNAFWLWCRYPLYNLLVNNREKQTFQSGYFTSSHCIGWSWFLLHIVGPTNSYML